MTVGADEQSFIELIIANERVGKWIDAINYEPPSRVRQAAIQLLKAVQDSPAYAEEAARAGAVQAATNLIKRTGDEELVDAASQIISICCGPTACGGKVFTFSYGSIEVKIKEGALGDGLGAKVWNISHALSRELEAYPELVRGHRVLEIGAGCGVNGIVAAKLGAEQVVMTDVEQAVLQNLRVCMMLNANECGSSASDLQQPGGAISDTELFDEAEEVDEEDGDLDDLFGGGRKGVQQDSRSASGKDDNGANGSSDSESWDAENMSVRLLDWSESLRALDGDSLKSQRRSFSSPASSSMPPSVPCSERFSVILGNEVIYEPLHAKLVASVIKHRLSPGGAAILCCAVRLQVLFDTLISECARRGLRYRTRQIQPGPDDRSLVGRSEHDYEGGYLMIAIDHQDSPYTAWHRDDFN